MADTIMRIPLGNEIRFVPEGETLPDRYHQQQPDRDWMYNLLLPFQLKRNYRQLKQNNDRNCIQCHFNTSDVNVHLEIWDTQGNIIDTINGAGYVFAGNTEDGIALTSKQFDFILGQTSVGTSEGVYHYVIKADYGGGIIKYFVSEPIHVKNNWRNSILIEYTHNENDFYVIFSQNARFSIRVEGYMIPIDVNEENTQFTDQYNVNKDLHSNTARVTKLQVNKIPFYLFEKLKEAFRCSNIRIERFRYSRNAGATWEREQNDVSPMMFNCSLLLNNYNPKDNFTFRSGSVLQVLPASGYPYAVAMTMLHDANFGFVNFQSLLNVIIEDSTGATNTVTALNAEAAIAGMEGTFSISGGFIIYTNAPGENFSVFFQLVKNKYFSIGVALSAANGKFELSHANTNTCIIDWGDSTVQPLYIPAGVTQSTPTAALNTVNHTYTNGSATTKTVRIFHNDDFTWLSLGNSGFTGAATSVTGVMSSTLRNYNVYYVDSAVTNWDLSCLSYCRQQLKVLLITGTPIQTLNNDPFLAFANQIGNFNHLKTIGFTGNQLTAAVVETFITAFWTHAIYWGGGGFLSFIQPPGITPTSNTLTIITALQNLGWIVLY
jgi:hypothetical protein